MKVFELLPKPLGNIFRKLTHFTCNSRDFKSQHGEEEGDDNQQEGQ